ncbi:MAG: RNA 2',3'-cyclic phosphodiesterase [Spirochaetota bacterium]
MKHARLFIAVRPSDDALAEVRAAREALRERLGDEAVRWVRDENLHVTLEFLGATDPTRIDDLVGAMRHAASSTDGPIGLDLAAPGAFPDVRRPRTLWISVTDPNRELARLEAELRHGLTEQGYELDARPFRPHITIGYVRKRAGAAQRRGIGDAIREADVRRRAFRASALLLVESVPGPGGSRYTDLRTVALAR